MNNEYSKGYQTGRKKGYQDALRELEGKFKEGFLSKKDKAHIAMLPHVLANCNGWSMGDKKINDVDGYSKITKMFVEKLISPEGR